MSGGGGVINQRRGWRGEGGEVLLPKYFGMHYEQLYEYEYDTGNGENSSTKTENKKKEFFSDKVVLATKSAYFATYFPNGFSPPYESVKHLRETN